MIIKNKSKYFFASALVFVFMLLLSYIYFFIYKKIIFLSEDIGSALRSVIVLEEKRKEFEVAKSNIEKQKENAAVLESAFFSENGFVNLLDVFEEMAKISGVKLEAKGAELPESDGNAKISFELVGNFSSIAGFLVLLDNVRFAGLVNKFSLTASEENSGVLTAKVDYLIFNYKANNEN